MKKALLLLAVLLLPLAARAQETGFAARASVGINYKISKGFHVAMNEEYRTGETFTTPGSVRTTIEFSYKPVKFLKLGAGYVLINPWKTSWGKFNNPRHRFYLDVAGNLRAGQFQFGLKERIQMTHRTGEFNPFQDARNAWELKSKLSVKWKGSNYVEPGIALEMRTALNEPWGSVAGSIQSKYADDGSIKTFYAYTPEGYKHVYNNRYRIEVNMDWNISKSHVLTPYVLVDFVADYKIDTNQEGTRLFSAAYQDYIRTSVGIEYTFKF